MKWRQWLWFAAIVMAQLAVIGYWVDAKENFNVDEFHSFGYARNFGMSGTTYRYVPDRPEWRFGEWGYNREYKKHFVITDDDFLRKQSLPAILRKLLTGRNYFGLLNLAESFWGSGGAVPARSGILLNLLVFVLAEAAVVMLLRQLRVSFVAQCLALAMFGFSAYVISIVVYIRFYVVVMLYLFLWLNLLYYLWNEKRWGRSAIAAGGVLALAYLAYKNTELTIPYFGAVTFCFVVVAMATKQWAKVAWGAALGLAAAAYVLMTTKYVKVLLHAEEYSPNVDTATAVGNRIWSASLRGLRKGLGAVAQLIANDYLGNLVLAVLCAGLIAMYLLWRRNAQGEALPPHWRLIGATSLLIALWGLFWWLSCHTLGWRLGIAGLCVLALFVVVAATRGCQGLRAHFREKLPYGPETGFVCILAGAFVIYAVFVAMAKLTLWRYCCFAILTMPVLIWYVIDRAISNFVAVTARKGVWTLLACFVMLAALSPFQARNVHYVYAEDQYLRRKIEPYVAMDTLLISGKDRFGAILKQDIYDCINLMSGSARICAIDVDAWESTRLEFPNEFILWSHVVRRDITPVLNDLTRHGYHIVLLGANHVSQVHICKRRLAPPASAAKSIG